MVIRHVVARLDVIIAVGVHHVAIGVNIIVAVEDIIAMELPLVAWVRHQSVIAATLPAIDDPTNVVPIVAVPAGNSSDARLAKKDAVVSD